MTVSQTPTSDEEATGELMTAENKDVQSPFPHREPSGLQSIQIRRLNCD